MKSNYTEIVTHPGTAHRDEFLGCAIAIAHADGKPTVFRRRATEEDLKDDNVLVLDTGGEYDPEFLNFDHHQMGRETEPACAFSLLCVSMGIEEYVKMASPWYTATEVLDSKGPAVLEKVLQAPWRSLVQMQSPVELFFLKKFSELDEVAPDSVIYGILGELGESILTNAVCFADRLSVLEQGGKMVNIKGVDVVFVPEALRDDEPAMAVDAWARRAYPGARISVTPDPASDGTTLYRMHTSFFNGIDVDFSNLRDDHRIAFAHQSGFLAKTKGACDELTIRELIEASIVPHRPRQATPPPRSAVQQAPPPPKKKWRKSREKAPHNSGSQQQRPFVKQHPNQVEYHDGPKNPHA